VDGFTAASLTGSPTGRAHPRIALAQGKFYLLLLSSPAVSARSSCATAALGIGSSPVDWLAWA
jgi:hypothetical protein